MKKLTVIAMLAIAPVLASAGDRPGEVLGPPRIDLLEDAYVVSDGEGGWLLTGTIATIGRGGKPSADYNRGAPLWRSANLKTWTGGAYAWDRFEHFQRDSKQAWADWGVPGERLNGYLGQATSTPELHHINGAWYLLCAMNHENIFLLKSKSGKPEGPYEDHSYLATRGGHPTLFTDSDGTHYLIVADAWIARLKPDLHELAEPIRPLLPTESSDRLTVGDCGVSLFKRDGRYHLLAPQWRVRNGMSSHDAALWIADNVYGPYRETSVFLEDTGPVTVFQDSKGAWHAVASTRCTDQGPRIVAVPVVK